MLKRLSIFLLSLSLITSLTYSPFLTPRAQAFLGVGDFGFDIEDVTKFILDAIAIPIAQKTVDEIVKSTVDWANTGFEGGPAYITDPEQFFANTADNITGEFIEGKDLGFLCSPFSNAVRGTLAIEYGASQGARDETFFSCKLSGVIDNLDAFYDDF